MRIRRVDINNFRGIKSTSWRLAKEQTFVALIGPGDSTKTTLLTALERALHDRAGLTFSDTDFYGVDIDVPIRIRVAVDDLPDELIAMDAFGAFLCGIDEVGEWSHDPSDDTNRCVIVELVVEADLEPVWQAYRPPLNADAGENSGETQETDEQAPLIRARHRARMTAYRIDDRVDAHLRWSATSSLGKLTAKRGDTKATLTVANRAARDAAGAAVTDELKDLAREVQAAVQEIGTAEFCDLKPGLDASLANTRGNLALFEGDVPLTNFGLGTRRLTGAATQQLANQGSTTLLVDEVEHGLEPHRLVHLLGHLRTKGAFSQVFVTTHSPTALLHLEPVDLMMVRSRTDGTTEVRSLGDPASLRPLLKRCPEAFLSRRVVINEGKTEYGVVLRLLQDWDSSAASSKDPAKTAAAAPSAALGVVALEGDGGTGSAKWAKEFLDVGYEVVLFIDSDDQAANDMVPDVERAGGVVVQWPGGVCIEAAVCSQLDAAGLTAYIHAALEVADDPSASSQSFSAYLTTYAVVDGKKPPELDLLDLTTWTTAGISLDDCRTAVATASKEKGWFKRVDKGQRLGTFILETASLHSGAVQDTLEALKSAIYARTASQVSMTDLTDLVADGAVDGVSSTGDGAPGNGAEAADPSAAGVTQPPPFEGPAGG
ncbi:ATP-binding protein [Nocardioides sp. YIM 152315]|uniref:ATP-dependent nuclease n=1 Tax=Nocardioides sp. YIM 152315 TaxID=3031760 RepID=UPI0023D98ED0|nr:ATP-binding protein [Nocardioides sp. YIM 152315]MDF1602257.1 AAA family ATPase [Nocardioides sp. YIM 152315]